MTSNKRYLSVIIILSFCLWYFIFVNNDPCNLKPQLTPESTYVFTNNLSCIVKRSSDKKDIGEKISLIDINTDNPKVLFGNSGGTSPLKKMYEDENTLTIGLIAFASGATDIFILDKKTGEFARTYSTVLFGIQTAASKGMCK